MSHITAFACAITLVVAAETSAFADDAVKTNQPAPPATPVIQVSRGDFLDL